MDVKEPSTTETLAAIVTPQADTALPSTATEQPTVYEVATAEMHEYLEAQSQSIAPEPNTVGLRNLFVEVGRGAEGQRRPGA